MNDMFEPNKTHGILYWNGIMEVEGLELNRKIERERIEKMSNQDIINYVDNSIEEIQKAIEAEREACATICETLELPEWPDKVRQPLAQAIRARGQA